MYITYLGHSAFKLRGKTGSVVTDPFDRSIGFSMPSVSADIVTVSHTQHEDHAAYSQVGGTARREKPYVITAPGEYEIAEIGVFGWGSYHDEVQGAKRGKNTIYNIHMDNVRVCHLGDLGHKLDDSLVEDIGAVDVLLVPVGGVYTIGAEEAAEVVSQLQPAMVIPMHYKTEQHDMKVFGELTGVEAFIKEMGGDGVEHTDKLSISETDLPEETQLVVLKVS